MSESLFVIAGQYRAAIDHLENSNLDAQTIADTIESIDGDIKDKSVNVAMFARNIEAQADAIKAQVILMSDRETALRKKVESIKDYLLGNLQHAKIEKVESPFFTIAVRKNPHSLHIDNERLLPQSFITTPPPPEPRIDKDALKKALKDGRIVPGAHLEQKFRIEIK